MPKPLVLVVGGAGYIGSYVNKLLNKSGYPTVVLDNLSKGDRDLVTSGTFLLGDMGDTHILDELFANYPIDAVMHFAAFTDVGESVQNPAIYYQNNVVNTLTLLNSMLKHGVNRLIFSSSAAIFGIPCQDLVNEEHTKIPINPYGETKLMVERILADYSVAYGLASCSLRYFNAAGADPDGELPLNIKLTNLIPVIVKSLRTGQPFKLFGNDYDTSDGTCIRDYIHIHDLATAHILALKKLLKDGKTCAYNLGNGNGFSVLEVIESARSVTKETLPYILAPRRQGDPPRLVADSKRAKQELGWTPIYPDIDTIIRDACGSNKVSH